MKSLRVSVADDVPPSDPTGPKAGAGRTDAPANLAAPVVARVAPVKARAARRPAEDPAPYLLLHVDPLDSSVLIVCR